MLDLRANGGGLLDEAVLVSSAFVPDGVIVTTKGRKRPKRVFKATGEVGDAQAGGGAGGSRHRERVRDRDRRAARAPRAPVVGRRTFGKGVFGQIFDLSNGGALDLVVGNYYTPTGRNLNGKGIRPDMRAARQPRHAARRGARAGARRAGRAERRARAMSGGCRPPRRADAPASGVARAARAASRSWSRSSSAGAGWPSTCARRRDVAVGDLVLVRPVAARRGAARARRWCASLGRPDVARDVVEALMSTAATTRASRARSRSEAQAAAAASADEDAAARPDRAAHLHDRPRERAGLRRRDLGRARRRRRCGSTCTSPTSPPSCGRARRSTRGAAARQQRLRARARSSRCCREALSSEACSLVPGDAAQRRHGRDLDRPRRDAVRSASFYRSTIRSDARLDYEEVDRVFAGARARAGAVAEPLALARAARRRAARARGWRAARSASRPPSRSSSSTTHGQRGRGARRGPDRVALGDRAADDPRQRAGRASGWQPARVGAPLPGARAARPGRGRAPRGAAREPRRADAAAARAHHAPRGRRAGRARSARSVLEYQRAHRPRRQARSPRWCCAR